MKRAYYLLLTAAVLSLEILPYGAVCVFASDPHSTVRETFSYFSLIPFGYANFGPLLTALCSCALFILAILYAIRPKRGIRMAIMILSLTALGLSLTPLLYGIRFYSVTAGLISALLLTQGILSLRLKEPSAG